MLSNGWHKNAACNPPTDYGCKYASSAIFTAFTRSSNNMSPSSLPPWKHNDSSAIFSSTILGCLRPMKQPGAALIISFIHIVGKTPRYSLFLWTETCATHSFCAECVGCDAWKWIFEVWIWGVFAFLLLSFFFFCKVISLLINAIRNLLLI